MSGEPVLIRATHPAAFRSGEWARLIGVERRLPGYPADERLMGGGESGRPCYIVEFLDGVEDYWLIDDPEYGYEFK